MTEDEQNSKEPKHRSTLDKVIMGAIIGTAIGSAIGASVAPKPGKETRELLKARTIGISDELKEVGALTRETTWGFFRLIKRLLFGRSKKSTHQMKEIPHEAEHITNQGIDKN